MDPGTEHQQQLRSLRDFLLVYNRMTELCFRHCICNLNYRLLTSREESCLQSCAARLVHANHRLMGAYVSLMPTILQRRLATQQEGTGLVTGEPQPEPQLEPSTGPDGSSQGDPGAGT